MTVRKVESYCIHLTSSEIDFSRKGQIKKFINGYGLDVYLNPEVGVILIEGIYSKNIAREFELKILEKFPVS